MLVENRLIARDRLVCGVDVDARSAVSVLLHNILRRLSLGLALPMHVPRSLCRLCIIDTVTTFLSIEPFGSGDT